MVREGGRRRESAGGGGRSHLDLTEQLLRADSMLLRALSSPLPRALSKPPPRPLAAALGTGAGGLICGETCSSRRKVVISSCLFMSFA